jgi:hypothetical protein
LDSLRCGTSLAGLRDTGPVAIDGRWRPLSLVLHLGEPLCDFRGCDGVGHAMAELVKGRFESLGEIPLVAVGLLVVDKSRLNKLFVPNATVGCDRGNDALSNSDLLGFIEVHRITERPNAPGLSLAVHVHKANPPNVASLFPFEYPSMLLLFPHSWHRTKPQCQDCKSTWLHNWLLEV